VTTAGAMPASARPGTGGWLVAWVSAAVLGFEISLLRMLLVASWHHFAFLVISVVLLGFGASGTALTLLRRRVLPRSGGVLFLLAWATAVSMPLCAAVAQQVPVEARLLPALLWRQLGYWLVYWAVLAVPFLLGAAVVCLALMAARERVGGVYAWNLLGSAAGAAGASVLMHRLPPEWLAPAMGAVAMVGVLGAPLARGRKGDAVSGDSGECDKGGHPLGDAAPSRSRFCWGVETALTRRALAGWTARVGWAIGGVALVAVWLWWDPPGIRLDPYKYGAFVRRLERQGDAERVAVAYGPRATVEAYRSDLFHDLPFLSGGPVPPPVLNLVSDGHRAGSVLRVDDPSEAAAVDHTLMAVAYELGAPGPRVLLLGETGGANVWLGIRRGAVRIDVVQPDANVPALLRGVLRGDGGGVLDRAGVAAHVAEPRHYVEQIAGRFEIIQLVTLESTAAGSGGVGGLGQDHLVTVEGISACLDRLAGDGLLFVCRGIQTPPRDNVKLLATFAEALRRRGMAEPGRHVVVLRDFQGVCTMVRARPWTPAEIEQVRRVCAERNLTPSWFCGIRPDELNRPDRLPGPDDGPGDWYHHAAGRLFSEEAGRFIDEWAFDICPPTDDRPFFRDFCKLGSIGPLKEACGDLWLTRAELGFLFVITATVLIAVAGVVLTLLPLAFLRGEARIAERWPAVGYFTAIGLAYLLLEMTLLARLTHLIGDPVRAAAVTISELLVCSGLGSLTAQRVRRRGAALLPPVMAGLVAAGIAGLVLAAWLPQVAGGLNTLARCGVAALFVAPLGYLMGFPMPTALDRLDRHAPALIPWAWAVNGFASVLAAPLATIIGMSAGFRLAGAVALVLYASAAVLFERLPGRGGCAG